MNPVGEGRERPTIQLLTRIPRRIRVRPTHN